VIEKTKPGVAIAEPPSTRPNVAAILAWLN